MFTNKVRRGSSSSGFLKENKEMDDLRVLDFDVLGTNPKNYIRDEQIPLTDKSCPWVIPNGAPFFETDVELYDERGALIPPRLYSFVADFIPFSELTGKPVWSFIELDESIRNNNAFITVNYRSIGAYWLPRNQLDEWLEKIKTGVIPVGWEKVYGLPLTYNPSWHIHSAITEIGDWYELTWFFQALTNIRLTRDPNLDIEIDAVVETAYQDMLRIKDEQLQRLFDHDHNYNDPHQIDKAHLLLGNRDNYRVATPEEEAEGKRTDVLSTPRGARLKIQSLIPDTEKLMQNGVMPISLLGGGDFIPPAIDGSFEGIGSDNESTGFCLENNGRLMLLTRHFDGRQAALFFSFVDNYKSNPNANTILFTGFKYSNQFISADGVEADSIVAGSNHKVLMVGAKNTPYWYLCLTNGTFNPSSHSFVKVDMTNVNLKAFNTPNTPNYIQDAKATVHRLGDWIYLIQSTHINGNGDSGTQYFFRVRVSDVLAGKNVSWEHVKLTYIDFDGVQRVNFDYYQMLTAVTTADGKYSKTGYYFDPPMSTYTGFYRKYVVYSGEHPTDKNRANIHMMGHMYLQYLVPGNNSAVGPDIDMTYEINPNTGALTIQDKAPLVKIDPTGLVRDLNGNIVPSPNPYGSDMTFSSGNSATVVLPNGDVLNSNGPDSAKTYPRNFVVMTAPSITNDWEATRRSIFTMSNVAGIQRYRQHSVIASPLKNNTYPSCVSYCFDGEVFTALNQNDNNRGMFLKRVTGPYQLRDEVKMKNYSRAVSRPLTNDVYKTNLLNWLTSINMTGTASQLSSAGREMGDYGMSVGKFINLTTYRADGNFLGAFEGIDHCWPKDFTRTLNQDMTARYDVTKRYGIKNALLQSLYNTHTPGSSKDKACTIAMFPAGNGPMFNGIEIGMAAFVYYVGNSTTRVRLVTFKPVIEAANAAHPTVDLITGLNVLAIKDEICNTSIIDSTFGIGVLDSTMVPNLQCYRDGNSMDFYWYTGFSYGVVGNTNIATCNATVNLVNGTITNYETTPSSWVVDVSNRQMIPRVGSCQNIFVNNGSSPSAQICQTPDGSQFFVVASTYPSPLWSVFFKEGTRVLINGTKYMLPIGVVDLRDIDPAPANKTFYIYVGVDENGAKYIISKNRLRHNNFLLPAATVICGEKQVLRIDTEQPFLIADLILGSDRRPGGIPTSTGLPMDEGSFRYIYSSDLVLQ